VTALTNRQVVERYFEAVVARNLDRQAEVCAQDMVTEYPSRASEFAVGQTSEPRMRTTLAVYRTRLLAK